MQDSRITVDTSRKAVIRRVLWGALFYGVLRLKGLVTMPIVTRYLDPASYGLASLVSTVVGMVWPVLALNLHSGTAAHLVHYRERSKISRAYYSAFNVAMGLSVVGGCILYLTAPWTGLTKAVSPFVLLTAVYLVAATAREFATLPLQVFQDTATLVAFNASLEIASVIIAVGMLALGYGLPGFLWSTVLCILVWSLILQFRHVRKFGYSAGWDRDLTIQFLRVGIPLMPVSFSQWALQSIDSYFILHYVGQAGVGINSVGYSLASIVVGYLVVLNYVYFPTLVAVWEESKDKFSRVVSESVRYSVIVLGAVVLGFVSFSAWAVQLLAGPNFSLASMVTPLVALSYSFDAVTQMYRAAYLTISKNTVPIALCHLAALILNVALNFTTIPRWGLLGAAVNTGLSYGLSLALIALLTRRRSQGLVTVTPLLRMIVPLGLAWALALRLPREGFLAAAGTYAVSLACYFVGIYTVRLVTSADFTTIQFLLKGDANG